MIRVLIYNEFRHEQTKEDVRAIYPDGIHGVLGDMLRQDGDIRVETVTLYGENGVENDLGALLTKERLESTDVLIWWGHARHALVPDEVAARVRDAVLGGMGAVFLHSAHHSKPFKLLMGTTCNVDWREDGDLCRVWAVDPSHPITEGVDRFIELPHEETYCEPFGIPEPDQLLFVSWFEGGEVFRSGAVWRRGYGKIFYFQPGHETYPIYHNAQVQRVIRNGVRWTARSKHPTTLGGAHIKKLGEA